MANPPNPKCVPLVLILQFNPTAKGLDYTDTLSEARNGVFEGSQAFWLYRHQAAQSHRIPIYRMTSAAGEPFAYGIQQREGNLHLQDLFLGYASTVQMEGMVRITFPRRTRLRPSESLSPSAFKDWEKGLPLYGYPAYGFYDQGAHGLTTDPSKDQDIDERDYIYESANYKHTYHVNKISPQMYRYTIENASTGLELQISNVGGSPIGDNTQGGGTGRGVQMAVGFQDFEGFEGDDPADHVCLTVHNPTQAGSQSGTFNFGRPDDSGVTQAGSIVTSYITGADFVELIVIPMDFVEVPPFGPSSPYPTPPAPCASEWHGQPGDGDNKTGAGIWETLRITQRLDFDWEGREGVHKFTHEFFTPLDIFSYAWQAHLQGVFNIGAGFNLVNAFDDAYLYDPVNHAAPLDMAAFTVPGVSVPGGLTVTGFEDLWSFTVSRDTLQGVQLGASEVITHTFPGPPATERRFESRRGGIFMRSRFPAAAAINDKFGLGVVSTLSNRGVWSVGGYGNLRSFALWPSEYTDTNENTQTFQTLGPSWLGVSAPGGFVSIPAGTWEGIQWLITDTLANFQGHVDWLESEGLL